jgi:hypothetical protein
MIIRFFQNKNLLNSYNHYKKIFDIEIKCDDVIFFVMSFLDDVIFIIYAVVCSHKKLGLPVRNVDNAIHYNQTSNLTIENIFTTRNSI